MHDVHHRIKNTKESRPRIVVGFGWAKILAAPRPGRRPHTTHPPGRGASIRREAEANKLLELPGIRSENLNRLFSFGYLPANYYSIHYSKNLYVN